MSQKKIYFLFIFFSILTTLKAQSKISLKTRDVEEGIYNLILQKRFSILTYLGGLRTSREKYGYSRLNFKITNVNKLDKTFFNMNRSVYENWVLIFKIVKENRIKFNLLYKSRLWHRYLMMINKGTDFYDGKQYVDTLWRGMIFNSILSYIENGYPDPEKTAAYMMQSMKIVSRQITDEGINQQYINERTYSE